MVTAVSETIAPLMYMNYRKRKPSQDHKTINLLMHKNYDRKLQNTP